MQHKMRHAIRKIADSFCIKFSPGKVRGNGVKSSGIRVSVFQQKKEKNKKC